jgi:hypothetical protein
VIEREATANYKVFVSNIELQLRPIDSVILDKNVEIKSDFK